MKIGFIVEGYTERIILKSENFQQYLKDNNLEFVHEVIVAGSKDNLSKDKIESNVQILRDKSADIILVLRDLDDCDDISTAKDKIITADDIAKVVAVRCIEAWFLADSKTLNTIFNSDDFQFEHPEQEDAPFEKLRELRQQYLGRGIGDKKVFARIMVSNGFSILNAANHPNCPSATYFLKKLQQIAAVN